MGVEGRWGRGGRLFEVGANLRLGAYSNKYGIYLVGGENLVQLSSVIHRGSSTNTLFHTMKAQNNIRNDELNLSKRENTLIKRALM